MECAMLYRLALLLACLIASVQPLRAQNIVKIDPAEAMPALPEAPGSDRLLAAAPAPAIKAIAAFGPFRVLDATRAALVDVTDSASPAQFAAMLRAYPGLSLIEMIECPGTEDDRANLRLGRMIHARGIATFVPAGGSVRSGGGELFLGGTRRIAGPAAQFVDLTPMNPRQARQRLVVLRDQLAQEGGNALELQIASHPSQEGALAIQRTALPPLDLAPAPAPAPAEAQQRIEGAAMVGAQNQRRAAPEERGRQEIVTRALKAVEERGGVASPAEARIFQEAGVGKPYDRID